MELRKAVRSEFVTGLIYDVDARRLRIIVKDGSAVVFSGVPLEVFRSFPAGPTADSFYLLKMRGFYVREANEPAPPPWKYKRLGESAEEKPSLPVSDSGVQAVRNGVEVPADAVDVPSVRPATRNVSRRSKKSQNNLPPGTEHGS